MTTGNPDRVEATLLAFLDYLEGHGERPGLEDLTEVERSEARELMTLMEGGRGIDPLQIPDPDVIAAPVSPGPRHPPVRGGSGALAEVIASLESFVRTGLEVLPAKADTMRSEGGADLVLRAAGLRIGVVLVQEPLTQDEVGARELLATADLFFYRSPGTAAVAFVGADPDHSCLIVEPHEARAAIELPGGDLTSPRPHRSVLPLELAVARFLEEVEVIWDEPSGLSRELGGEFDVGEAALRAAEAVLADVAEQGRRAIIPEKRKTWSELGEPEVQAIVRVVVDAHKSRTGAEALANALEELARKAA